MGQWTTFFANYNLIVALKMLSLLESTIWIECISFPTNYCEHSQLDVSMHWVWALPKTYTLQCSGVKKCWNISPIFRDRERYTSVLRTYHYIWKASEAHFLFHIFLTHFSVASQIITFNHLHITICWCVDGMHMNIVTRCDNKFAGGPPLQRKNWYECE